MNGATLRGVTMAFALLTAAGCDVTSSVVRGVRPNPAGRIIVLGDSLAVSPSREDGFPAIVQKRLLEAELPWTVVNAGIRGDTTTGGLRRVEALLAQRPAILVLALGANDGLQGVDVLTISRNLDQMIRRAKAQDVRVLLCGMELPPVRGFGYARAFSGVFATLAEQHDVALVPFLLEGVALNREMNGQDFIHPNAQGANRIADNIWPHLEPLVR
jgi:acyl-CoA thioesterase-1